MYRCALIIVVGSSFVNFPLFHFLQVVFAVLTLFVNRALAKFLAMDFKKYSKKAVYFIVIEISPGFDT